MVWIGMDVQLAWEASLRRAAPPISANVGKSPAFATMCLSRLATDQVPSPPEFSDELSHDPFIGGSIGGIFGEISAYSALSVGSAHLCIAAGHGGRIGFKPWFINATCAVDDVAAQDGSFPRAAR